MSTRGRRNTTAEREITPTETGDTVRHDVRTYFREAEEAMLQKLTSEVLRPERIRAVVEDEYGERLIRMEESCRALAQNHQGLREKFLLFTEEPCKNELQSLRDELSVIRDHVTGEFQKLWRAINTLQRAPPRAANKDNEPEATLSNDDVDPPIRPRKERGSKESRSRNSRAKKGRSSRSRPKGRKYYESESDSSTSSDESDDDDDLNNPNGDEIRVADRDCRKVLNVETYRLTDRDPERDLALRTTKVLANLRHLFDGERFDGSDPLTVLPFLEELQATFEDAGLCEGDAKHMIRYFLTGEAARLFKGLAPRDKKSYPRIIKWLLRTYVRESMLQNAREAFLTRAQKSTETELEYSQALSDLAKRCAGMIPAKDLINRFIRGLRPAIRTQVQSRVAKNTSWAVAVAIATEHGNAHREAQKEQDSGRDPAFMPTSRRRYPVGRAKALAIRHSERDEGSDADEVWPHEEDPGVFDARGNTVGAIYTGSPRLRRDASYVSLPTSLSSSSERYYTPQPSFPRREAPEKKPADNSRKVMLPPGIPYPAKSTSYAPATSQAKVTNALPCLGCGKTGHWLSDCPKTNPRLKS